MATTLPNLYWIEELLPAEIISKKMFGGVAYYLDQKLVLILIESDESRMHKGIEYDFGIWWGCLFPVEKIKQNKVFLNFPFLENHPASGKWLYLPMDSEDFDDNAKTMIREIKKQNPLLGTFTAAATKAPRSAYRGADNEAKPKVVQKNKPTIFSDAPPANRAAKKAKKQLKKEAVNKPKKAASAKEKNALLMGLVKGSRR